ncbi:hypothetical protein ACIBQ0_16930 [Nocardia nova]|uniref:hypothetical protein n=1 Tax=Nocardia nova TaxID=37330 RepID=UPI0037A351FD
MGKHNRSGWKAIVGLVRANMHGEHQPRHDRELGGTPVCYLVGDWVDAEWLTEFEAVQR